MTSRMLFVLRGTIRIAVLDDDPTMIVGRNLIGEGPFEEIPGKSYEKHQYEKRSRNLSPFRLHDSSHSH